MYRLCAGIYKTHGSCASCVCHLITLENIKTKVSGHQFQKFSVLGTIKINPLRKAIKKLKIIKCMLCVYYSWNIKHIIPKEKMSSEPSQRRPYCGLCWSYTHANQCLRCHLNFNI